ncbi:hypothetical protein DPMN_076337 [Dreissena polymorpha]|uniref:Secreted protein n=1 Tax=Dreissena polymorpha TaxID=45954 RepID=A0A9D3YIW3_DREPO|nr:hypothetical protein DPMN_076337 [Dreissena polymorpha]
MRPLHGKCLFVRAFWIGCNGTGASVCGTTLGTLQTSSTFLWNLHVFHGHMESHVPMMSPPFLSSDLGKKPGPLLLSIGWSISVAISWRTYTTGMCVVRGQISVTCTGKSGLSFRNVIRCSRSRCEPEESVILTSTR